MRNIFSQVHILALTTYVQFKCLSVGRRRAQRTSMHIGLLSNSGYPEIDSGFVILMISDGLGKLLEQFEFGGHHFESPVAAPNSRPSSSKE